jgi:hypothetical protein
MVECRTAAVNDVVNGTSEGLPDAVVMFPIIRKDELVREMFPDRVWSRTIVLARDKEILEGDLPYLRSAAAVCVTEPSSAEALRRAGIRPWQSASGQQSNPTFADALAVLQPLSLVLGGSQPLPANGKCAAPVTSSNVGDAELVDFHTRLPIWMYWEGPCPEWIQECQRTIFAHSHDVRLLSPEGFDALRDHDRDIDLNVLHVAHRADYIRAFLLARYGGMWIDSDCLVLKSLQTILDKLAGYDFVAHRERSGYVSNGFIAARQGSVVAAALYKRICELLRSRRPLGWISLGSEALTEILNSVPAPWCEIECETVQPICWSNPGAFYARAGREQHDRNFDARTICYMLSNTEVKKFQVQQPLLSLLAPGTFFNYLLHRALNSDRLGRRGDVEMDSRACGPGGQPNSGSGTGMLEFALRKVPRAISDSGLGGRAGFVSAEGPAGIAEPESPGKLMPSDAADVEAIFLRMASLYTQVGDDSVSGPGSSFMHTAEIRERLPLLIEDLQALRLLDAACGDFHWIREIKLGVEEYLGVDVLSQQIAQNNRAYGSSRRKFLRLDIRRDPLPEMDLILCRDCLVHFCYENVFQAVRNFRRSGSKYLLTTTFVKHSANHDIVTGEWRPLNLQLAPFHFPPPLRTITEKCTEGGGRYSDKSLGLWRLDDIHLPPRAAREF